MAELLVQNLFEENILGTRDVDFLIGPRNIANQILGRIR